MASSDTHGAVRVDPGNEGALAAWDGPDGAYWARYADHFDRSVTPHTEALMGAAAIATGERVLDVGCGSGQTTRRAAQAATGGSAVGIDLSREMLAVARSRAIAEGLTNVEFVQGDAQVHPFEPGAFDVVISRTGAMFFADPVAAFGNIGRGMADGGRLALLVWQGAERNEWIASFLGAVAAGRDLPTPPPGAPGPFSLADPDRVNAVLGDAGFIDIALEGVEAPMWFGTDAHDAGAFVGELGVVKFLLSDLSDSARAEAEAALRATIAAHETAAGVFYESAAWLVTARRSQPAAGASGAGALR